MPPPSEAAFFCPKHTIFHRGIEMTRTSWRVEPSQGIASIVKALAAREQRSVASVVTMLVGKAIDRERLDSAVEAAGLSKAIRTLELRAVSEMKKNEAPSK
jgi:hypothetical protein